MSEDQLLSNEPFYGSVLASEGGVLVVILIYKRFKKIIVIRMDFPLLLHMFPLTWYPVDGP